VSGDESGGRIFRSAGHRRQALLATGVLVAVALGASAAAWSWAPQAFDPAWFRARIAETGRAAPAVFVAVQAAQVVFAPIPGQVLGGVGGYLFGGLRGTAYSMLGVTIGSLLVFGASRRYGRPFVARVVTDETLTRFDGFVERHGRIGLFVVFLLPTFPDDAICLIAGLTTLRVRTFLLLLLVGRTPAFLAAAYAGTALSAGREWVFVALVGALVVASLVVHRYRSRIVAVLEKQTTE
jgi:uncharacterized membrane protein YdjX (TVP38/TMEM64 family)